MAVIFDLDGTLVDTLADITSSLNHVLAARGLATHSRADTRRFIGHGAKELVAGAARSHADVSDDDVHALTLAFREHYTANLIALSAPYEGINDALDGLVARGEALAIVSNKPHAMVETIVARFFGDRPFSPVYGVGPVKPKPDPSGILRAAKEMGVAPSNCSYVGDSEVDVEVAATAGMRSVAVAWGFRDESALVGADRLVRAPSELLDALI